MIGFVETTIPPAEPLAEDVRGEVGSLPITNMKADIIIGEDLAILNQETGETYEVTVSQTTPVGSGTTQLSIEGDRDTGTARVIANEGDAIVRPASWRQAREIITPDQIKTDVRRERERRSVAQLSQDINIQDGTSLPVQYLDSPLDSGQKIELIRLKYADDPVGILVPDVNVYEIEVASDVASSSSATSIPIEPDNIIAEAGDPIYVRNSTMNSQIIQNADSIVLKVSEGEVASQLTIELESITADTAVLKSDNWDGSVDSNGNITAYGTQGWAITGSGEVHLAFSNGDINIDERGIQLEATDSAANEQTLEFVQGGTRTAAIWQEDAAAGEFKIQSFDGRVFVLSAADDLRLVSTGGDIHVGAEPDFHGGTSTSASAGSNGDVPAQVEGYINAQVDHQSVRIPYYST